MTVAYGLQQVLNLFHIFDLRDFQHIGIFIVRILKIDWGVNPFDQFIPGVLSLNFRTWSHLVH